jgi:hypothetical protein
MQKSYNCFQFCKAVGSVTNNTQWDRATKEVFVEILLCKEDCQRTNACRGKSIQDMGLLDATAHQTQGDLMTPAPVRMNL